MVMPIFPDCVLLFLLPLSKKVSATCLPLTYQTSITEDLLLQCMYMVKYIEGMKERGIEIDMISIQNEPAAKQEWASCKYEADEEAEFAVDYLYPALEKRGLQDKVKIVIWDHNRDLTIYSAHAA